MRHDCPLAGCEHAGDQALAVVERPDPAAVDPAVHSLEFAAFDEALELAMAHAEFERSAGGDEPGVPGEMFDEERLHTGTVG